MAGVYLPFSELRELLLWEAVERFEEGYDIDVDEFREEVRAASTISDLVRLYERLERLEVRRDYGYREPSEWREICLERPGRLPKYVVELKRSELMDRVLGAWLSRCAGCMLGKPVEGWEREKIVRALRRAGEYPLRGPYLPLSAFSELGTGQLAHVAPLTREGLRRAERDDDLDYTVLNLLIYEERGSRFTTEDVAKAWLRMLPYHLTYTAERAAYRNLVIGLKPPETATFLNPYREWIGAQIRADLWGYVSPGDPERAVEYAYRDARLSHTKNGIYGEMFVAALIALAYVHEDPLRLIMEALRAVPERSRLAEAIKYVVALYKKGLGWEEAVEEILTRYGRYHPVHTVNNAAIVVAALLWGEGDFTRTITYAVLAGLDTDCNGATAGSVVGLMLGASKLPMEWVRPLNDTLATGLSGLGEVRISRLAERTVECILASA